MAVAGGNGPVGTRSGHADQLPRESLRHRLRPRQPGARLRRRAQCGRAGGRAAALRQDLDRRNGAPTAGAGRDLQLDRVRRLGGDRRLQQAAQPPGKRVRRRAAGQRRRGLAGRPGSGNGGRGRLGAPGRRGAARRRRRVRGERRRRGPVPIRARSGRRPVAGGADAAAGLARRGRSPCSAKTGRCARS